MLLFIQCIVLCIIFSLIILPSVFSNPLNHLKSYPKAIRQRVQSLPEYNDKITKAGLKDILRKIIGAILVVIGLTTICYYSNATTFKSAFIHSFVLFQSVNIFDVIVLDIIIFCNSKKVIIKGTEDMHSDYKNKMHHIIGGFYGLGLGLIISLIVASLIMLF